jgi:peptidoglycan hydrolase-like protein with peptidoglycan-binding domain
VIRPVRTRLLLAAVAAAGSLVGCAEDRLVPLSSAHVGEGAASTVADDADGMAGTLAGPGLATDAPAAAPDAAPAAPAEAPPTAAIDAVGAAEVIQAGPKGLAAGAKGALVNALEARLATLRFSPGHADGTYDQKLTMAVMAFQKQQNLPRTGRADPATLARLAEVGLGGPMVATGEPTRVEIDLNRQIVQFWKDGTLLRVLPVSTGNGRPYCAPKDKGGACDVAITPGGSFRADRKIAGLRESALGSLYDPVYFYGGIAIHGSGSIPATPASHGCVRVPMWESSFVYNTISVGDPVYVVGGKVAPVPFGETAPLETPDEVTVPAADAAAT